MSAQSDQIAIYLEERRGYVARNLPDRVRLVDAELARLGYKATPETAQAPIAERAIAPKPTRGRKAP
jgi:hypothetical protein